MLKMIDVLGQDIVQSFCNSLSSANEQITELLHEGILKASDHDLKTAIIGFFNRIDATEISTLLDIPEQRIADLKAGILLKDEQFLADTFKVVALGLALETNSIELVEVSDCLQDYPI